MNTGHRSGARCGHDMHYPGDACLASPASAAPPDKGPGEPAPQKEEQQ